jgi:hypothetical protein
LKRKHQGYGDTFYIDEVFAGVPDHSDQWQAVLFFGEQSIKRACPMSIASALGMERSEYICS